MSAVSLHPKVRLVVKSNGLSLVGSGVLAPPLWAQYDANVETSAEHCLMVMPAYDLVPAVWRNSIFITQQ